MEYNSDLLIKCLEEYGAKVTPGTGKIFIDGKEISISEALMLFSPDVTIEEIEE